MSSCLYVMLFYKCKGDLVYLEIDMFTLYHLVRFVLLGVSLLCAQFVLKRRIVLNGYRRSDA